MSFLQILVLAIVQGITEFLPISSSGHLILVPELTRWPDQGLIIDVASHVGTLAAVLIYFWRDVAAMIRGVARLATAPRGTPAEPAARQAGYLLAGTIPALAAGFAIDQFAGNALRDMAVVAWTLIGFGIVLYVADRIGPMRLKLEDMRFGHAIIVGLAQALAFIPGTSRSGVTMVAARLLGYQRVEAARFSFLLSVPAIAAAGLWEGLKLVRAGNTEALGDAALTMVLSAVAGILAIAFLMRWLRRATFTPFVIYRIILGAVLLWMVYA